MESTVGGIVMGNLSSKIITIMDTNMESAVGGGTKMGNLGMNIITIKTKNMESAVGGTQVENFGMKRITFKANF